ncbi:MAG: T9SS type A sorting domain-containing protein [Flavobacteriales bacterium]|nr:T9SS type A sorting domain-containing protein [Flavobacteriales bacterium]
MNRVYSLACLLLITGSALAQRTSLAPRKHSMGIAPKPLAMDKEPAGQAKDGATVFSEDFANGLAGNNGVGAWSTAGPDGALWLLDLDGPNGDFSNPATEKIQSTTVSNGFMIFDSNLSNDGCVATSSCAIRDGWLISPVLDLSATPYVHLIFEQRLRWCCSANPGHFVDVSTDGGATWPTRVIVDDGISVNQISPTQTRRVNLGAAIQANPANVRFRFAHDGTASGNMTHYFWQVDDVRLVESPDYDMVIQNAFYDEWFFATSVDYSTIEYGMYPYSQLRPLTLKANVINDGRLDQTNVELAFDVTNTGGTSVFSATDTRALISAAAKDSLYATFTPPAVSSTYTVNYVLSSDDADENPADNTASRSFMVDQYQYALDNNSTSGFDDNAGAAYRIGNHFHIVTSTELTAIRVAVANGSVAGTVISAELLDVNLDLIEETQEKTIVAADLNATGQNKFITLPFSTPQFLNGGEDYFVCLKHFGGADNVRVAVSGTSERTASLIYDTPTDTWFFLTATPMVRMTFDPTVGIEERDVVNGVGLGQNFPNPSNGSTVVPYSLESAAQVTFRLFDVSGKLIMERNEGSKPAGQFRIQLDTQHLNEGMYFYTLTAGDVQLTKRMTVVR